MKKRPEYNLSARRKSLGENESGGTKRKHGLKILWLKGRKGSWR